MWAYLKSVYISDPISCRDPIPSLDACSMIYYVKNNAFLHSLSLKSINLLFIDSITSNLDIMLQAVQNFFTITTKMMDILSRPNKATKHSLLWDSQIHNANGNQLPITTTGDISSSLTNVFVSLGLMSNLVSIGQLVNNDCRVQFSQSGCLVQDQHSGEIIAKGPNLEFFSYSFLAISKSLFTFTSWTSQLMLKSGFLGNKHTLSLNVVHFDCISCKLGKSKILSFLTHHLNVTQHFDIIHSDVCGWHQLYLIPITNILLLSLIIVVVSLRFILCTQKMKCFPLSSSFMLMFKNLILFQNKKISL
ncbi:hypothetical protein CR513_22248, partial [Mucuna pruriens]